MQVYWDWTTLLIYIIMATGGVLCLNNRSKYTIVINKVHKINMAYTLFFIVWVVFAAYRYIAPNGIGGTDAYSYVEYFEKCIYAVSNSFSYRAEVGFRFFNQFLRHITDDYHIYLIIVYSVIVGSYIYFVKTFKNKYSSSALYVVSLFYFVNSFCVLRSSLASAILLIGITFLYKKKYFWAAFLGIISIFIHSSLIFYLGFYVFWFLFKKKKLTVKICIMFAVLGLVVGKVFQTLVISDTLNIISGTPIDVYVGYSMSKGFFADYWKIIISQLLLVVIFVIYRRKLLSRVKLFDDGAKEQFYFIYVTCLYDLLLIPILLVLNVWRGIEYFFWPRLIMWGYIIKVIASQVSGKSRRIIYVGAVVCGYAYMIFRIYTQYDMGGLMPYIFAPFAGI